MRIRIFALANQLLSKIMDHIRGTLAGAPQAAGFARSGVRLGSFARRHGTATNECPGSRPGDRWSSTLVIGAGLAMAMLLAVVAALFKSPGDAIILTVLTLLGMIGVFFLFAASVGLIQFGLREDKRALEHLLMRSPDGVLILAPDGTPLRYNTAFARLAPNPSSRVAGLAALEAMFQASEDGQSALFRLLRAARVGQSAEETITIAPARDQLWPGTWRISTTALEGADGIDRATEWRVRRLAENESGRDAGFEQLNRDAASFENLPVGMLIASGEGRILSANACIRTWTGLTAEAFETSGMALADIFPELGGREDDLALAAAPSGSLSVLTEVDAPRTLRLHRSDGTEAAYKVAFSRQAGKTGRIIVTVHDAPAVSSGHTVKLSESQGANLFNAAPIAISVVDTAGTIQSANDAFARMFGESATNLLESVSSETRDQVQFVLNAAIDGDLHPGPVEITVASNGEKKGRVFISPAHPDGAQGDSAIVYAIDMTKQRELETQFAQSQKMQAVGQLAGGMAHDFNNLLTIITLSSDFLLSSHQKSDPAFKDIMQIKQVAGRAAEIVKQLLAFSRQQTLLPEVLSLTDEISDWTTTLRPLLGERVTLDTDNGRDLWMVKADKSQLGQVIVNLAVNARDAMLEDGALTIRTRNVTAPEISRLAEKEILPADYVLCEVSDTGTGMTDDVREKIFDPFFSTKDVGKGTGLGLSTVYGIIKQTGGYIFCDSAVGEGTTFRIYLPRHDSRDEPVAVAVREPVVAKKAADDDMTGTAVVVLVEDEEPVRRLAARALTRQGFQVLEAGSGVEALEVIAAHTGNVDLVISDIVMPEMDGPTLLKEIRRDTPDMKLIFISGYAEDALKTLNQDEEFAFLPKPFQLADLVSKVKDTLGR